MLRARLESLDEGPVAARLQCRMEEICSQELGVIHGVISARLESRRE